MLDREEAERILRKVISYSKADGVEAHIGGGRLELTRFAENHIHQNVAEHGYRLSVRSIIGNKTGRAETNALNEDSIKRTTEDSQEITRHMPEDPELLPLLEPQRYRDVNAYCEVTAAFGPEDRARAIKEAIQICHARDCTAAGAFLIIEGSYKEWGDIGTIAMMNSKGLFAYHARTIASFSITVTSKKGDNIGRGWAGAVHHSVKGIDINRLTEIALDKAVSSLQTRRLKPGRYDVLLEPQAVSELMSYVAAAFSSQDVDEGRSFLMGKVGERIAAEDLNMKDNAYHPLCQDIPFDGEGVPKKEVKLIENGIARELLYDRKGAKRHNTIPTGHGPKVPSILGPSPSSIVIEGTKKGISELLRSFRKGILVTRFWYTNYVDVRKCIVTGLTRDGTFWVEDGKILYAINNFRINQNLPELLHNIIDRSTSVQVGGMVAPAMLVKDFNFSSVTEGC
jgi:predicted Zn-dependent protease